jgi:hypothetical protein
MAASSGRLTAFLALAELRLAAREAALSSDGLEQRFEKQKLFGDDDDHAFRPPYGYYWAVRRKTWIAPSADAHPFPDDIDAIDGVSDFRWRFALKMSCLGARSQCSSGPRLGDCL